MKPSFAKTRLILSSLVVLAVGAVYVFGVDKIIIPTTPANHRATLVEVQLGMWSDEKRQWIKAGQNKEVIIPNGLIAGEVATNSAMAPNSVIGGGYESNTIGGWWDNSFIAAGRHNTISGANSFIGAGYRNIIDINGEGAFIGGGEENEITAPFSVIGGGYKNTISAPYSVIPGGSNNTITDKAPYSFVAGSMARAQHTGTFIWSDYDVNYRQDDASPRSITDGEIRSQKSNTFLIRALSGMSINTPDAIPGVNVNINGAVQMKSEGLLAIEISDAVKGKPDMNNTAFAYSGTYENVDGCVYFADGLYRQLLNISNPSNVKRCGEDSPFSGNIAYENCFLYKGESAEMRFRAGNKIETYKAYASDEAEGWNCESSANKKTITCQIDGKRNPEGYEHINCTPWRPYSPDE